MARPKAPARRTSASTSTGVSGNRTPTTLSASASVYRAGRKSQPTTDRRQIAKRWQIEAYEHVNKCGEARYAATLFAAIAGRAEIGISEPQALAGKAVWVRQGTEVEVLAEIMPTVRDRTKFIRDYVLHRVIAGECYLVARDRIDTDPDPDNPLPIWEVVAVTELRKIGMGTAERWEVRHENGNWITLNTGDPVIRMWCQDPSNRMEAWSPFRSMLPTLREIDYLTKHIFTQVRSRLMSAGVWFLPNNLTFPPPPVDAVEGGEEAIAAMNEAEQFMISLAAASMQMLEADEPAMPTVVLADAVALDSVKQEKLIKFWSEIDDKAMMLRSDAVRRFALGMDMPPEQILGSSGIAVTGAGGSAGSVNHWGVWANEEQTISAHVEPALDDLVHVLTVAVLRNAVEGTDKVVAYDTATLRLRQDRSKESMELYDRGILKAEVMVREVGFDPESDMMDDEEFRKWMLTQIAKGSATPDMVAAANELLGIDLPVPLGPPQVVPGEVAERQPGRALPPSLKEHPYEGPPRVDHEHNDAPYGLGTAPTSALVASCEALVIRAMEKYGNRLINAGLRGKDRDRSTPLHLVHLGMALSETVMPADLDFSMADTLLSDLPAMRKELVVRGLGRYVANLYNSGESYRRADLIEAVKGL